MKDVLLPNICINFHVIHDQKWFENVIRLLRRMYTMVSLEELYAFYYEGLPLKNACHITLDDGDRTVYENVFPILKKYNVPASIYVSPEATIEQQNFWFQEITGYDQNVLMKVINELKCTGTNIPDNLINSVLKKMALDDIWEIINTYRERTGTPNKPCCNMDADQIIELDRSGLVAVGAHTLCHPILKNESDERATQEIKGSIEQLSEILNRNVIHFAYPNGRFGDDFGERELNLLKESGVKLAFSMDKGNITAITSALNIPRDALTKQGGVRVFFKLIMGKKWDRVRKVIGN